MNRRNVSQKNPLYIDEKKHQQATTLKNVADLITKSEEKQHIRNRIYVITYKERINKNII